MGLFDAMDVSASGLTAERLRMDTIANNLANSNSVKGADGKPFQRQVVEIAAKSGSAAAGGYATFGDFQGDGFSGGMGGGPNGGVVAYGIKTDTTPGRKIYDPGNPDADAKGYVEMSNVNPVTEMTDLITATRAYEADTSAIKSVEGMAQHALDVIR
jgi:flagellar basal-body rod protein FlgC